MKLMRIIILILVASFFYTGVAQEKNHGRVHYSRQSNFGFTENKAVDSNQITKTNSEIIGIMNFSNSNFQYILEFNDNESIFKLDDKLNLDTNDLRLSKMFGGNGVYYSNSKKEENFRQVDSFGDLFLINLGYNLNEWELLNETKKIGEFLCYKAITVKIVENRKIFKKQITAWYYPEISVPFGPIGYGGLPGLIIELSVENEATYSLQKLELNPKLKVVIAKPLKGNNVTENEYNEIGKKIFENLIKRKN